MSDIRASRVNSFIPLRLQRGATTVEVAILFVVFFMIVDATLEVARLMYVYNTLQEVTRRAASELVNKAPADPDSAAIIDVRRRAIFQTTGDQLFFASQVGTSHVRVDYQSLVRDAADGSLKRVSTSPLPTCAAKNRQTCMANPNDAACVRFVRVRICEPGDSATCNPVRYQTIFPFVSMSIYLPISSTIAPAESLGYLPGMTPCQ